MARRDEAMKEAAFMRGDTGIDGGATNEDTRDAAEIEQEKSREGFLRGRTWLGRELLTWLLWQSEKGDPLFQHEGHDVVFTYVDRLTLRGLHGDVSELSVKGTLSPYSEQVRFALERGLLVHNARIRLTSAERTWETFLDAEYLDVRSAKLPELLSEEEDDRISERLDLAEQLSTMLERAVNEFLRLRASPSWAREAVPGMKAWMRGEPGASRPLLERARRARA